MYRLYSPADLLSPYVDCYWTLHTPRSQHLRVAERVFVDGRADIIFNFGCPYHRRRLTTPEESQTLPHSNLDAPRNHPVLIAQEGEVHLTGIRFKPGGLSVFLPVPLHELLNQVVDLSCFFGPGITELESRLYDQMEAPELQVELLDRFLLGHLQPRLKNEMAFQIAQRVTGSAGRLSIHHLSRELGYSPRHLDRLYQHTFGMSPKFHARIVRFQHALHRLLACPEEDLSELALACGYYDQPHLTREFQAFAGQSPIRYRDQLAARNPEAPPPNLVRFLQDS